MTIDAHEKTFAGKAIADWEPGKPVPPPAKSAVRLALDWDQYEQGQTMVDRVKALAARPEAKELEALVIGPWDFESSTDSSGIVAALAGAAAAFPRLTAIFLGDIVVEEQEISWIQQSDVSPLLAAYPRLEELKVRGGTELALSRPDHAALRRLVLESGGLPTSVVAAVGRASLPALRHLELWLGSDNYGGDARADDLAPILAGDRLPSLRTLGLRDSEIADELAAAVVRAPILSRLRVLDLSLGTLSDEGGEHLVASPAIAALERLDLHHHYLSEAMQQRLAALKPVQVDLSDAREPDRYDGEEHRYCAVSE